MVDIDLAALGLSEEEKAQVAVLAGYERARRSYERFVPFVKISESGGRDGPVVGMGAYQDHEPGIV